MVFAVVRHIIPFEMLFEILPAVEVIADLGSVFVVIEPDILYLVLRFFLFHINSVEKTIPRQSLAGVDVRRQNSFALGRILPSFQPEFIRQQCFSLRNTKGTEFATFHLSN